MKHYEYAVTCEPGTLVDVGEIHGEWDCTFHSRMKDAWSIADVFISNAMYQCHTILIGPVEYDTTGETISIKGDE